MSCLVQTPFSYVLSGLEAVQISLTHCVFLMQSCEWLVMFYLAKSQLNRQVDEILFDFNHEEIDSSWTICDFFRDMSADDNFVQYYRRIERAIQRVMYYSLVPVAIVVFIAALFAELW